MKSSRQVNNDRTWANIHMAGFLTRRVALLALVASVLCGYLITRAYGVEVLTVTLIGVIALAGMVMLLWRLSRMRQLSMRTLVFVLPLSVSASPSRKLVVAGLPTSQAIRLARWKQCTSLSLWEAELSLPDCHELAALELEELELGKVCREQLQILLESKSLKRLLASVVGVDEAELQRIKTQALPDKQLNFGRLR